MNVHSSTVTGKILANKTVLLRDRKRRTARAPPPPPPPPPKVSKMFVQFFVQNVCPKFCPFLVPNFVQHFCPNLLGGGVPPGAPPQLGGGTPGAPLWTDKLKTLPSRHTPYAGGNYWGKIMKKQPFVHIARHGTEPAYSIKLPNNKIAKTSFPNA